MQMITENLTNPAFQIVLLAVIIAGIARGFSGFGTGMIVAPVAAAMFSPKIALIMLVVMDSWPAIIPALQSRRKVQWSEVRPILAGFVLALPLGVAFIKYGDATLLRWFISAIILISVSVLWSGWQYRGPRNFPISASVGALSGFLGGSTQIPGPPAIIYWMATKTGVGIVRANILMLFLMTEFISMGGYYLGGLFTWESALKGLLASPIFFLGIMIGGSLFTKASEQTFRTITFLLILCSAIMSLPVLDQLLR
ncbi:MAG: sulfite exporter TauE/SafE family protein [Hyphomicrobiales bacterium]|nr:sulfite exporter TauE/SafE family protein [Hyphomicrobiales bacterium]